LTNKTALNAATLALLPDVRYIGVLATGYNVVDVPAATSRGIIVTNVPAYSSDSVAQTVFAHILNLSNNVAGHAASVTAGNGRIASISATGKPRSWNCTDFL